MSERDLARRDLHEYFSEMLRGLGEPDMPIAYLNDGGPREEAPFLSLEFRSLSALGMPERGMANAAGEQAMAQHMRQGMTMRAHGERACAALETMRALLLSDVWADRLRRRGLVVPQAMDCAESPRYFGADWEKGASFDFDLTYTRVARTRPGFIEHVILTPTIVGRRNA